MGTLLAIDTPSSVVLAVVSALSVPVPAQGAENEICIAELGLVGELAKDAGGRPLSFSRGTATYPTLGDRVRFATKSELRSTYCGDDSRSVRVGSIRQDFSIPAMVRVDELLGKHFAILGTTGTGKSCSTALILRAILEKNPNAHIVLLDPHNEYATAFGERAEVVSPRNMQLPLWLLNFEEAVEVLVGDPTRKVEIEILQDLIPSPRAATARGARASSQKLRKSLPRHRTLHRRHAGPLPRSRISRASSTSAWASSRTSAISPPIASSRRGLRPSRRTGATRSCSARSPSTTAWRRCSRALFRVPVNGKPITIVELTGLPPEVVNVVVSVLCRMAFDFALWSEGQVPVTLVCEEAHRYVPLNAQLGFEPCKRAIAKIAKEGRKYGASLCIVTQRPAEIDPTILSQCNTVFALRMSNERDQAIVTSAISDTGSGLLEFLPALGQREAIAFGDGVALPVRIRFDEMPEAVPAALLDGAVLGEVADLGRRRGLPRDRRRALAGGGRQRPRFQRPGPDAGRCREPAARPVDDGPPPRRVGRRAPRRGRGRLGARERRPGRRDRGSPDAPALRRPPPPARPHPGRASGRRGPFQLAQARSGGPSRRAMARPPAMPAPRCASASSGRRRPDKAPRRPGAPRRCPILRPGLAHLLLGAYQSIFRNGQLADTSHG